MEEHKRLQTEIKDKQRELGTEVYSLLYNFSYSTAIYRAIHSRNSKEYSLQDVKDHFWNAVSENCLQKAIEDWCKVFGSHRDRTHYSKMYPDQVEIFKQAVRKEGINLEEYSDHMKNVRDKFISHCDEYDERKPVPDLDPALIITDLFENIVLCGKPGRIPFDLLSFFVSSEDEISEYLDSLGINNIGHQRCADVGE